MMTLDRHDSSVSQQSVSSDRPPTNITIRNSDKENKTTNYLEILDAKFNKRGRSNKNMTRENKVKSKA
jgi:hypothetical protein